MANVIFYSTGEIFWVSDPPSPFGKTHIGVPSVFPAVPPDHFFTYSMVAHVLEQNGHKVVGAFGRQREQVRLTKEDPEILALGSIENPENTVIIIISTDSGIRPPYGHGSDYYDRIPFTQNEKENIKIFCSNGGGLFVTSDHGPLGYESLKELELHLPIDPEPEKPFTLRPNVEWSNDSTDSAKARVLGQKKTIVNGEIKYEDYDDVWLSVGPPAGFLQKIVPAELLYKKQVTSPDGSIIRVDNPQTPHPVFNGVGDIDGIWIPAHMHEAKFKIKASLRGIDETMVAEHKIKTLAVHVPFTETTFSSFAVMCYRDSEWEIVNEVRKIKQGRVLWDSSFHHLVDINWAADGKVTWDPYVPFSAQALWKQQLPPEQFERRMDKGMRRLIVNIISWLAHELPGKPSSQIISSTTIEKGGKAFLQDSLIAYIAEDNYPEPKDLIH